MRLFREFFTRISIVEQIFKSQFKKLFFSQLFRLITFYHFCPLKFFWNRDSKEFGKKKILCTITPVCSSGNIFHNYSTTSKLVNVHWYNPQNLFRFYQLYMCSYVCMFICLRSFITCRSLCNHHCSEESELFHHHEAPSCYPFIPTSVLTPPILSLWQPPLSALAP